MVYCFSLYETALVFVKVIESPKTYTSAHRTHELGFTAHKKFWKSHSDLIVWHKKIIICLLNANCCFLVWAWDFFFSFQCVIYSALPSNTRMSIFRKIALSARKIFKYVAENERRVESNNVSLISFPMVISWYLSNLMARKSIKVYNWLT